MFRTKFVLYGLIAALPALPAFAMEAPAEAEVPAAGGEVLDEVTVVGQRSLLALRLQVEAAQEEVHLLFNELNTDDAFDIVCKHEERYFSRMREKNCMPQYAWDARAREGQVFAQKITGQQHAEGPPANLSIDMAEPRLKEQMIEALRNSPELFDAIVKHARLMEELAEAQATYFGEAEEQAKK